MYVNSFIAPLIDDVLLKFREADALSKETSKSLSEIGLDTASNREHKYALKYLKSIWYIRKYKGLYYLDENAISNPGKTSLKRTIAITSIIMVVVFLLFGILILLDELNLV